jgi:hypothetical protein
MVNSQASQVSPLTYLKRSKKGRPYNNSIDHQHNNKENDSE